MIIPFIILIYMTIIVIKTAQTNLDEALFKCFCAIIFSFCGIKFNDFMKEIIDKKLKEYKNQ